MANPKGLLKRQICPEKCLIKNHQTKNDTIPHNGIDGESSSTAMLGSFHPAVRKPISKQMSHPSFFGLPSKHQQARKHL
jgi:hypothetical protein